jgi:transaldolase
MADTRLHSLAEQGQSPWLDFLSRDLIKSGELERRFRGDAITGVTSNPTIFQGAIASGNAYDEQLRELLAEEDDPRTLFFRLAARDVREACDLLRDAWENGARGRDGHVSLEVDPGLAHDTQATIEQAQHLSDLVERRNLYVKIPATKEGLPAIEEMIARGVPINVTLIFSLARYAEVAEAYIRGVERFVEGGGDASTVTSVASFFVSRVDTEVDRRLDELGGHDELRGRLAIANAKLAYQEYRKLFAGERWERLSANGAIPQYCLWASTSTKNPEYRDVMYVEKLIGPDTVNTMPEETIGAFQDHGRVEPTLEHGLDEAKAVLERLAEVGIDYDDVTETLEREGVKKFADSFDELLEGIRTTSRDLVAA